MSLGKSPYPLLITGSIQEDPSRHNRKLFSGMLRIKPNKQNILCVQLTRSILQQKCTDECSYLVKIDSAEEDQFLRDTLTSLGLGLTGK